MAAIDKSDTREEDVAKLARLIKDIDIAMLTTLEDDGTFHSRPMQTQVKEFDGDLWFFTRASAPKVNEVQHHKNVNLSYAAPSHNRYVSVTGTASLSFDRAKIEEFWNPAYKAWFPDGLDDPDLALLKVSVEKAEYWDTPSSPVVHLAGFVKAMATGKPYQPGENKEIELAKA